MRISAAVLFALALSWLAKEEIPPANDPDHPGQPEWCQRHDSKKYRGNCERCEKSCDGNEDTHCTTYCRKGSCKCHPDCDT